MAKRSYYPPAPDLPQKAADAPEEATVVLHPVQSAFRYCTKPYKAFTAGRGAGKSVVGAYDHLVSSTPGTVSMVIAPTYKMLMDSTQRTFIEIARKLGLWDDSRFHKTDNIAFLTNGHEVIFRSGEEPDKLRGSTVKRIWADECSLLKEAVYSIAIACLRWPGTDPLVFAGTFTPSGKDHWTYRVFGDTTNPNVALFKCSTKDNPFLPPTFYEQLLLEYGKGEGGQLRALQELEGEFVCVEGAEWGPECFTDDIWFDEWPDDDQAIKVITLDSSKGTGGKSGDYSVFTKLMYSKNLLWAEFDLDNLRNSSMICTTGVEMQRSWRAHYFGVESEFGGNVLADDLLNRAEQVGIIMPVVLVPTQGLPKEVRIRRLTPYLTRKMIRFRNTEQTRLGVQMFESFPHGTHDDSCDSLEMAIRIINESGLIF